MRRTEVKRIVEAALLAADDPVSIDRLAALFTAAELAAAAQDASEARPAVQETPTGDEQTPAVGPRTVVRAALADIERDAEGRGYELAHVASGYRLQVRQELSPWVSRLFEQRPPRYSRALLETLSLIVYRQPITRGEVEEVRGVAVSASIMRTLLERGWIRAVGQRETPGRPTMYGTTRAFLDYFNLRSLSELPPLDEIKSLIQPALEQDDSNEAARASGAREGGDEAPAPMPPDDDAVPSNVVRLPTADGVDDS